MSQKDNHYLVHCCTADGESRCRALAFVGVDDPSSVRRRLENLRERLLEDRFRARLTSVQELRHRSFDFDADHASVRELVVSELEVVDHESYVSVSPCGRSGESSEGSEWHRRVLNGMLSARLASTRGLVNLYVDESVEFVVDKASRWSAPIDLLDGNHGGVGWNRVRINTIPQSDCLKTLPTYVAHGIRAAVEFGLRADGVNVNLLRRLVSRVRVVSDTDRGILYTGALFVSELCR